MPPQTRVATVMLQVLLALLPGVLAYSWFFGPGMGIQIILDQTVDGDHKKR